MLSISSSTYSGLRLNLKPGSTDSVFNVVFSGTLTVDSAANTMTPAGPTITGNDFSGVGSAGVVASGDKNATIYLTGNYWGTTDPIQIAAKIEDHNDNGNLPTIAFSPYITNGASGTAAAPVTATFSPTDQTIDLSATVFTTAGIPIDGGTETFTIFNGTTVIGQTTAPTSYPTATCSTLRIPCPKKPQQASTSSRRATAVQRVTCPRPTRFIS